MAQGPLVAVVAGLAAGILLIVLFALVDPLHFGSTADIANSTKPTAPIIHESEAEAAARDDLDRIAQSNGEQSGVYRGGKLGSAYLVYVDKDGTNYIVDTSGGISGEKLPYPIDGSKPSQYIWHITLNVGNSSKPEYIYAVDAYNGHAWMIGVID